MALSNLLMLFFVIVFIYPVSTLGTSSTLSASNQLKYWFENVENNMPESLLSKLSPLTLRDSEYFTSLVTDHEHSFSSSANFCSRAKLACSPKLGVIRQGKDDNIYNNVQAVASAAVQVDPSSFFRQSVLKQGNRIHLSNLHYQFPPRAFLPSRIASQIPLDENDLQKMFPQTFADAKAKEATKTTLFLCNAPAIKGEIKSCPKSLEEMIEFSKAALGSDKNLVALTTKNTEGSQKELVIGNIKKINKEKIVSCHEVFLPFATYFCHLLSSTDLYAVEMVEPETKTAVNTVYTTCHLDTSEWPKNHVAFKILKSSPGKGEACHWMTQNDLAWIADH